MSVVVSAILSQTPDVSSAITMPEKPQKDNCAGNNKRPIVEIQTNPIPAPAKKTRGSSESTFGDSMGQNESLLSQTDPTQSETIIPDCSQVSAKDDDESLASEHNTLLQVNETQDEETLKLSTDILPSTVFTSRGEPPPSPRWGHTMTKLDGNRILVYGGQSFDAETGRPTILSDIHVYDMSKCIWYKPVNSEGVPRQWHSATYLPERKLLISFGGETTNPKNGKVQSTDQVMVLDSEIMLWYPPSVSGTVPTGRSGHTATILPDSNDLVVFGGVKGSKWQNSLAVLDISRWTWRVPKISGNAPRPRSYHSATPTRGANGKSQLVIFGGNDRDTSFNTVHVLETDGTTWSWINPKVSGNVPPPRTGHCATLLSDKKSIMIYGGWDPNAEDELGGNDEDKFFGDSYILNTETWEFRVGPKPSFAGDGLSGSQSLAKNGGACRVGHKSVLVKTESGSEVLVFGGRVPGDAFVCDFQKLKA